MHFTVHQTIIIHHFRVNNVSNSSVLQIGSSGMIQGLSNLYNTGGYAGPAPELKNGLNGQSSMPPAFTPLITLP